MNLEFGLASVEISETTTTTKKKTKYYKKYKSRKSWHTDKREDAIKKKRKRIFWINYVAVICSRLFMTMAGKYLDCDISLYSVQIYYVFVFFPPQHTVASESIGTAPKTFGFEIKRRTRDNRFNVPICRSICKSIRTDCLKLNRNKSRLIFGGCI